MKIRAHDLVSSEDFIARMRWILFLLALLFLVLAFQVGDDWYVREFANYDWARLIGY